MDLSELFSAEAGAERPDAPGDRKSGIARAIIALRAEKPVARTARGPELLRSLHLDKGDRT